MDCGALFVQVTMVQEKNRKGRGGTFFLLWGEKKEIDIDKKGNIQG